MSLNTASEASLLDAQAHWAGIYKKDSCPSRRTIALCELEAIRQEIETRRGLGLWRTGAYPGKSTFKRG